MQPQLTESNCVSHRPHGTPLARAEVGSGVAPGGDTPCGPECSSRPASRPASCVDGPRRGRLPARPRPLRRARRDPAAGDRGERRGGAVEPAVPSRRPRLDRLDRAGRVPVPRRHRGAARPPQQARLRRARGGPGGAHRAPPLVGQHDRARAHARRRALRGRDAGRHGPGARPRDGARGRRRRRDARERLRRRGGPRRRPAAGAARRRRAHVRALGRRGRGAAAVRPRRGDDEFARWDGMRESEDRWAARSSEYLPDELDAYAGEFERTATGSTRARSATSGSRTSRSAGSPTRTASWAWTPYGWTWVPYERWGWAPFHYGRWGYSASFGWYWMPGRTWGPGWVSWAVGGGYVGWCPLGRHDQPVSALGLPRRPRRLRPSRGRLRARPLERRAPAATSAAATSPAPRAARPDRSGRAPRGRLGRSCGPPATRAACADGGDVPRAISRRMTPGDFVRELGVDNKTTIPAPWTRGYGPPPAGVDGARYGTPRRTDGRRRQALPGQRTHVRVGRPIGGRRDLGAAEPAPAPWYTPRPRRTRRTSAGRRHGRHPRPVPRRRRRGPLGHVAPPESSDRVEPAERTERSAARVQRRSPAERG